jgi:hypothetical protein
MSEFRTLQHFCNETKKLEIFEEYEINKCGEVYCLNFKNTGKREKCTIGTRYKNYKCVSIKQKKYQLHRLLMSTFRANEFDWSKIDVDHIDQNPENNKLENLRWATRSQNNQNKKVKGVSYCKKIEKWHARIKIDQKQIHLGFFDERQDAVNARLKKEKEIGWNIF